MLQQTRHIQVSLARPVHVVVEIRPDRGRAADEGRDGFGDPEVAANGGVVEVGRDAGGDGAVAEVAFAGFGDCSERREQNRAVSARERGEEEKGCDHARGGQRRTVVGV